MHDPIALAVPLFFLLIAIEYAWAERRGVKVYRLTDSVTNLSCGITSQIVLVAWAALHLRIYASVHEHFALVPLERAPSWVPWVVAFFGVDLLYYFWHRLSHEVNVMWAAHVVHHQSEDYNLAVALRQAVFTSWTALPFYLPLAVLGVPVHVFALVHALSTLYQFWIHTELVGKIRGPLDWVLNLPSHHRVHHAINPRYLDKNYGATLIVWDRLFGTYVEETDEPVYGITKRLGTFDPIWAQIHYWFEMAAMARAARRPAEKLRVLFASPAWKPEGFQAGDPPDVLARPKYDRPISKRLAAYVGANYVVVVVVTFLLLLFHASLPRTVLVGGAVAVLASVASFGALFEKRSWARAFEITRLAGCAVLVLTVSMTGCRRKHEDVRIVPVAGESPVLPRRAPPPRPEVRTELRTIDVAGAARRYLVVEPRALDRSKEHALVLVFHGDGGDAVGFHDGFPFEKGSGDAAILAYLDGIGRTWDLESRRGVNKDIKFAKEVIATISKERRVDPSRIFAAGYSSGGFFSNVLACNEPGLLRAIASNAGGAPYNQPEGWPNGYPKCPGQKPVATIALHGERDISVTLDSGRFSAAYWAYVNGCNTQEMETTGYPECHAYRGCPAGLAVVFCDIPPLGHWVWDRSAEASWIFFERDVATSAN